jgi:hypothetical protein
VPAKSLEGGCFEEQQVDVDGIGGTRDTGMDDGFLEIAASDGGFGPRAMFTVIGKHGICDPAAVFVAEGSIGSKVQLVIWPWLTGRYSADAFLSAQVIEFLFADGDWIADERAIDRLVRRQENRATDVPEDGSQDAREKRLCGHFPAADDLEFFEGIELWIHGRI